MFTTVTMSLFEGFLGTLKLFVLTLAFPLAFQYTSWIVLILVLGLFLILQLIH